MEALAIHMYLTTVCNLNCTHCYYDARRVGDDPGLMLNTEEVARVITHLCGRFEADLHVEGGELFLRDDIDDILTLVPPEHHRSLTFTTSGTVPIRVSTERLKGIGELRIQRRQIGQLLGRSLDDPDRLAAPLDGHHLTGLQLADIHLNRSTGCLGSFGRRQARDKRYGGGYSAHAPRSRRHQQQLAPTRIHFLIHAHGPLTSIKETSKIAIRKTCGV